MSKNGTKILKVKNGETLDTFFHGSIQVLQRRKGYRFAVDAPLLSDFVRTAPEDEICELGTGNGIVALLLSIKPFARLTAVEIQAGLADIARRNVMLNNLGERITIVRADLRNWEPDKLFDTIVCNPPYIKMGIGHLSSCEEKAIAKHEVKVTISEILAKTSALLKENGRAFFIFPKKREADFDEASKSAGLIPVKIRYIQPRVDTPANLFLIKLTKGKRVDTGYVPARVPTKGSAPFADTKVEYISPLILYDPSGEWSEEAKSIFAGRETTG